MSECSQRSIKSPRPQICSVMAKNGQRQVMNIAHNNVGHRTISGIDCQKIMDSIDIYNKLVCFFLYKNHFLRAKEHRNVYHKPLNNIFIV